MYSAFGCCKNYTIISIHGRADCRNCSQNTNPESRVYKVGDWCRNYHDRKNRRVQKSKVIKPETLVSPKNSQRRKV